GQLLRHDAVVEKVSAGAAVLDRLIRAEKPGFAHLAPGRAVAHADAVPFIDFRRDFSVDETAHLLAEHLVFFGKNLSSHRGGTYHILMRLCLLSETSL